VDTTTLAGQRAGMEYDGAYNLISYRKPGSPSANKYKLDYGKHKKQHLLKKTTTPEGMVQTYKHDLYGNTTMRQNGKDRNTGFIRTETAYTADGNFAVKRTDARGKATTMELHEETGLLQSVTAPDGVKVTYAYDSQNRLTETSCDPAGSQSLYQNKYAYDESGRLKTVSHNTSMDAQDDVTYTFEYDALGAQTEVRVGPQTLSTNEYAADRTRKLLSSEFANGGKIVNTYDDFDRITGVHFDEETEPRYTYEYGANGQAAYLTDKHLGRRHWTEYDLAMRPKRATTLDSAANEILYRATLKYDKDGQVTEVAFDDDNRKDKTVAHGALIPEEVVPRI
jgi:YD repeat-containing protein